MTIVFHPGAQAEHLDQVAWYESRQQGLGSRYLAALESVLGKIAAAPARFPVSRLPSIRRAQVADFPISVIFRVSAKGVEVLAVSHHRRRPGYWFSRSHR